MSHYIEKCPQCYAVLSQCRCMACDKEERWSLEPCEKCKKDNQQLKVGGEVIQDMILRKPVQVGWIQITGGISCCQWCGKDLSSATSVTYLNGNQACCDLCLGNKGKR
jgi:hypothetical protein